MISRGLDPNQGFPHSSRKETPFEKRRSVITSKAQTTIPQSVRSALRLKEGDEIAYAIEGERVVLTRAPTEATDDPFATFSEWNSEADRRAYAKL